MSQIIIEHFHGAASACRSPTRPARCASAGFNVVVIGQWTEPKDTDAGKGWCRNTFTSLEPFLGATRYVNYLEDDVAGDPAAVAYGPNYARLKQLKKKYDPDNFFHTNVNIRPA